MVDLEINDLNRNLSMFILNVFAYIKFIKKIDLFYHPFNLNNLRLNIRKNIKWAIQNYN